MKAVSQFREAAFGFIRILTQIARFCAFFLSFGMII